MFQSLTESVTFIIGKDPEEVIEAFKEYNNNLPEYLRYKQLNPADSKMAIIPGISYIEFHRTVWIQEEYKKGGKE